MQFFVVNYSKFCHGLNKYIYRDVEAVLLIMDLGFYLSLGSLAQD